MCPCLCLPVSGSAFLSACACACTCACVCACACVSAFVSTCAFVSACACACACVSVSVPVSVCLWSWFCVCYSVCLPLTLYMCLSVWVTNASGPYHPEYPSRPHSLHTSTSNASLEIISRSIRSMLRRMTSINYPPINNTHVISQSIKVISKTETAAMSLPIVLWDLYLLQPVNRLPHNS